MTSPGTNALCLMFFVQFLPEHGLRAGLTMYVGVLVLFDIVFPALLTWQRFRLLKTCKKLLDLGEQEEAARAAKYIFLMKPTWCEQGFNATSLLFFEKATDDPLKSRGEREVRTSILSNLSGLDKRVYDYFCK